MSKLIQTWMASALLLGGTVANASTTITIKGHISSKPNCTGTGICTAKMDDAAIDAVTLGLNYDSRSNTITLLIADDQYATLNDVVKANLNNNVFVMSAEFAFSADINARLGATDPIVLPAGNYTSRHAGGQYTILIPLQ